MVPPPASGSEMIRAGNQCAVRSLGRILECSTLKIEVIGSSETLVHIRTTLWYIPEDGKLHTCCWKNIKFCITDCILMNLFVLLIGLKSYRLTWTALKVCLTDLNSNWLLFHTFLWGMNISPCITCSVPHCMHMAQNPVTIFKKLSVNLKVWGTCYCLPF
jgi:hypothetical protein